MIAISQVFLLISATTFLFSSLVVFGRILPYYKGNQKYSIQKIRENM